MNEGLATILLVLFAATMLAVVFTSGDDKHPPRGVCTAHRYSVVSPTTGHEWFGVSTRTCTDTTEAPHADR